MYDQDEGEARIPRSAVRAAREGSRMANVSSIHDHDDDVPCCSTKTCLKRLCMQQVSVTGLSVVEQTLKSETHVVTRGEKHAWKTSRLGNTQITLVNSVRLGGNISAFVAIF